MTPFLIRKTADGTTRADSETLEADKKWGKLELEFWEKMFDGESWKFPHLKRGYASKAILAKQRNDTIETLEGMNETSEEVNNRYLVNLTISLTVVI